MNTETIKAQLIAALTAVYTAGGSYVLAKANAAEKRARKAGMTHDEALATAIEVRTVLKVGPRGEKNHPPLYR